MSCLKEKNNEIKKAIVEAIAFFDIFDVYLTGFDIWQSINVKAKLGDILDVLENDRPKNVKRSGPFYFLKGREDRLNNFYKQYDMSEDRMKKAQRVSQLLRYLSGIKMIAVCNNFYYTENSDIDMFIVVSKKRMWSTRLFATVLTHILGLRRHGKKIANRACLSFYITEDNASLDEIRLKNGDPYFDYWFKYLRVVYDDGLYETIFKKNDWVKKSLPNMFKQNPIDRTLVLDNNLSKFLKGLNSVWSDSFLGDLVEKVLRKIQLKKMSGNLNTVACENDTRVIITDKVLKFHENDRRLEFKEKLQYNLKNLYENN